MDTVDLNNSPDLTMEEITKQLFNNEFLSDIQFRIDDQVLFAHSWELMKRSVVFRQHFRGNLGDNKLIPIDDVSYKAVYEFLRFIYTDVIEIEEAIKCDVLKLAVKYKIVKLENIILNMNCELETDLKYFEFSVVNKYELCYNFLFDFLIGILHNVIQSEIFVGVDLNVVECLLKSDRMPTGMTEFKLFSALVDWMNRSCVENNLPIIQQRALFDILLQLIRFPNMTADEFRLCVNDNPDLFTCDDISIICHQMTLGPQFEDLKWISKPRLEYSPPFGSKLCPSRRKWETKFNVSQNLILNGLRYGCGSPNYEIHIFGRDLTSNETNVRSFKFTDSRSLYNLISLGESIQLHPNIEYTIEIRFKNNQTFMRVNYRKPDTKVIVSGPLDLVTFTEFSDNLFEIFFKLPND